MDILASILYEGVITFAKTGLTIQGSTKDKHVRLFMPSSAAESCVCPETPVDIGVDFKALSGWLKSVEKGDIISFEVIRDKDQDKKVLLYRHWNDKINHEVRHTVLELESPSTQTRGAKEYEAIVTMSAQQFEESLKRHCTGAKSVQFGVTLGPNDIPHLEISSTGTTSAKTTKPCQFVPVAMYDNLRVASNKTEKFGLKPLKQISRAYSVAKNVIVGVTSAQPHLLLKYPLGLFGYLEFIIQPLDDSAPAPNPKRKQPGDSLPANPPVLERQDAAIYHSQLHDPELRQAYDDQKLEAKLKAVKRRRKNKPLKAATVESCP
jgi:hypothetical protein